MLKDYYDGFNHHYFMVVEIYEFNTIVFERRFEI